MPSQDLFSCRQRQTCVSHSKTCGRELSCNVAFFVCFCYRRVKGGYSFFSFFFNPLRFITEGSILAISCQARSFFRAVCGLGERITLNLLSGAEAQPQMLFHIPQFNTLKWATSQKLTKNEVLSTHSYWPKKVRGHTMSGAWELEMLRPPVFPVEDHWRFFH